MKLYVQYLEDGTINGTVMGSNGAPPHPRQLEFEVDNDQSPPNVDGMRVDLDTLQLVPCPAIAKARHNAAILYQLQVIDAATPRALREYHLTSDKTALQSLEDKAAVLRPQLQK